MFNLSLNRIYLIKSLITSPAIINPTTDGTKEILPDIDFQVFSSIKSDF